MSSEETLEHLRDIGRGANKYRVYFTNPAGKLGHTIVRGDTTSDARRSFNDELPDYTVDDVEERTQGSIDHPKR